MANEGPNKRSWLVPVAAFGMGAIVAALGVGFIYNFHIAQIRRALVGEQVAVLLVVKDLQAGEQIKPDHLQKAVMSKSIAENLDSPMYADAYEYAMTQTVNQAVRRNHYLTWADVTKDRDFREEAGLLPGMVAVAVQVDPRMTPNEILRIRDHVNLLGVFTVDGKTSYLPIIEGVRVIEIGGSKRAASGSLGTTDLSSFQSISIVVPPGVSVQLANVLSHAEAVRVTLRSPSDEFPPSPQISPQVKKLSDTARPDPVWPISLATMPALPGCEIPLTHEVRKEN